MAPRPRACRSRRPLPLDQVLVTTGPDGRRLLRFTVSVANAGKGRSGRCHPPAHRRRVDGVPARLPGGRDPATSSPLQGGLVFVGSTAHGHGTSGSRSLRASSSRNEASLHIRYSAASACTTAPGIGPQLPGAPRESRPYPRDDCGKKRGPQAGDGRLGRLEGDYYWRIPGQAIDVTALPTAATGSWSSPTPQLVPGVQRAEQRHVGRGRDHRPVRRGSPAQPAVLAAQRQPLTTPGVSPSSESSVASASTSASAGGGYRLFGIAITASPLREPSGSRSRSPRLRRTARARRRASRRLQVHVRRRLAPLDLLGGDGRLEELRDPGGLEHGVDDPPIRGGRQPESVRRRKPAHRVDCAVHERKLLGVPSFHTPRTTSASISCGASASPITSCM